MIENAHARTPSNCCRSTTTAPRTSRRRGATPLAAGRSAQEKWANLEAAGFYEAHSRSPRSIPELAPAQIAEVWEALGDRLQLVGNFDRCSGRLRGGARALADQLTRADRADPQRGLAPRRHGTVCRGDRLVRARSAARPRPAPERPHPRTNLRIELSLGYAGGALPRRPSSRTASGGARTSSSRHSRSTTTKQLAIRLHASFISSTQSSRLARARCF